MSSKFQYVFLSLVAALFLALAASAYAELDVSDNTTHAAERNLFTAIADTLDTRALSYGNATASTADLTWSNEVVYTIGNYIYGLAAGTADLSGQGTWAAQANGTAQRYVFHVDSAGTVNATLGPPVASDADPEFPELVEGVCPFATVKVVNTSGSAFTLGTTSFATSNVTDTWNDLSALPTQALDR